MARAASGLPGEALVPRFRRGAGRLAWGTCAAPTAVVMTQPTEGAMQQQVQRVTALKDIEIVPRSKGGDGRTVTAYAAVFNRPTEIQDSDGHYLEQIAPTAFDRSLAERSRKIGVFYNHGKTLYGQSSEIGSVPIGSAVEPPRPDGKGLLTVTRYNRTPLADAVLEAIRNGDITGQSFTGVFRRSDPANGPWFPDRSGRLTTVTRQDIDLIEYGPTPVPAYEDAEIVGVRGLNPSAGAVVWDPAERQMFLRQLDAQAELERTRAARKHAEETERRALAVPELTGDHVADLAAACDHAERMYLLLDAAELRRADAASMALATGDPADAAAAGHARARRDVLHAAWQRAVAHRDQLEAREREAEDWAAVLAMQARGW